MKIVIGGTFVYAEIKECRIKSIFNADLLQLVQNVGKQTDVFTLKDTRLNSITIALSFDDFIQKLQYLEIVNVIFTGVIPCLHVNDYHWHRHSTGARHDLNLTTPIL